MLEREYFWEDASHQELRQEFYWKWLRLKQAKLRLLHNFGSAHMIMPIGGSVGEELKSRYRALPNSQHKTIEKHTWGLPKAVSDSYIFPTLAWSLNWQLINTDQLKRPARLSQPRHCSAFWTNLRFLHLATVLGLIAYLLARTSRLSWLFWIVRRTASVVLAHPCNICPIIPPWMVF